MITELYQSALYPSEIKAMFKIKKDSAKYAPPKESLKELAKVQSDIEFCYSALGKVSRSFSVVIKQLPEQLRDDVCIFYLVLRALDTVEDDMNYPYEKRMPLLQAFYEKCDDEDFYLEGVGDQQDYVDLLEHYPKITRVFKTLDPGAQEIIKDITKKMGAGMAHFATEDVITNEDFDLYCHYVAGLVGIGLSKLFANSGVEKKEMMDMEALSNSMGLFLQKTNIIRDYHEDLHSDRVFLPKSIWGKYENTIDLFEQNIDKQSSMDCLNDLLNNALTHIPDCITYLNTLQNKEVFKFCAIPQVMAIATLEKLYNNKDVFAKNVKIRKGLAAKLMLETTDMNDVKQYFKKFLLSIDEKANSSNKIHKETRQIVKKGLQSLEL
ncbi:MAG: squalene synthase [Crocinitomicaceae bacterium]|nr:squalene synthase [Crocinitomicaceae bacterium]